MQKQSWQFLNRVLALTAAGAMAMSLTTVAAAQRISGEDRSAIFATAPRLQTNVKGVTVFAAPPKNFNPLTASNHDLLSYGLPQAPDKAADPKSYEHWAKAMAAIKIHATGVQAKPYSSMNMKAAGQATPDASGTSNFTSFNWSGIANTNTNTKWNTKTSFDEVVSYWNVPVPNHPFGNLPCTEGPWYEVTWNGIDGFNNGDVVQGGTADYWDGGGCGGAVETFGWVEWFPSYSILAVSCGNNLCPVGPGDDFVAITFGAPGFAEQSVFVEDITQQWAGTIGLVYQSGPGVVGNSAEYIVERPCCSNGNYFALANYIFEFMGYNYAYNGKGALFYPGNTSSSTAIITMLADDGSTNISTPFLYGSTGNAGRYSIMLEDENCAYSGGCTP